jgi:hypothetical protein
MAAIKVFDRDTPFQVLVVVIGNFLISEAVQKVTKKQCLMRKFVALDSYNAPEAGVVMLATQ